MAGVPLAADHVRIADIKSKPKTVKISRRGAENAETVTDKFVVEHYSLQATPMQD
jgi:hypothetical protein